MTARIPCLALLGVSLWIAEPSAQGGTRTPPESIKVGTVTLTLGMTPAEVGAAVGGSKEYSLRYPDAEPPKPTRYSNMFVWSVENAKPKDVLATVSFKDGRLGWVYKIWTIGPKSDVSVAAAVHGAVNSLLNSGAKTCEISKGEELRPDLESREAVIRCGRREISISITRDPLRRIDDTASVAERLVALDFGPEPLK